MQTQAATPAPETQAPLPDPVHRFTLPPVLENRPSQEALDAANLHYAQALEAMARGIHTRAQTRAKLHAQLFPLVDDTQNDQALLDIHPQLHRTLEQLNQNTCDHDPCDHDPCNQDPCDQDQLDQQPQTLSS